MNKHIDYHRDWQNNRIEFMLSVYGSDFFKSKKILELGSYNGYIGSYFNELGSKVQCVDGRKDNVDYIIKNYDNLIVEEKNLDTKEWILGKHDIIINFGLYYHLQNHHIEHLKNCIDNCDIMFFESVIYDSSQSEIYFRYEDGDDQSLSNVGGTPSTSFVENIFLEKNVKFTKYTSKELNDGYHFYDWLDSDSKIFNEYSRRFWIIEKK
jgi:hypothetical protein